MQENTKRNLPVIVLAIVAVVSIAGNLYLWNQKDTVTIEGFNSQYQELLKTKSTEAEAQDALIASMKENPDILNVSRKDGAYPGISYEYCTAHGSAEDSWENLKNVK
jgi:hypothetical protein